MPVLIDLFPVWPPGWCGSISHSAGIAVAVAARTRDWRAIGIDIEPQLGGRRIRVVEQAMRPDERADAHASTDPWVWTRAWACKEAAWKCLSPLGAEPAFDTLVPRWLAPDRAEILVLIADATARLEIDVHLHGDLFWALARLRTTQ